ncbi:MAG: PAS domain-containing protein, partial [Sulfurimonadaceae bacterium]
KINERYELTHAGIGDGIWDRDLVNDTVFFSKRWKEMLGFKEDEIENEFDEWESRVHPDDIKQAFTDFEANIAGETERYENLHRLKHKDGHWVWILDRGKTIFDEEGKAVRMLGTHTDVTEKKALEDKMAKNEARLTEAQRIAHLGTWEWDLVNHTITWSDELYRLLGEAPQSFKPTYKTLITYLVVSEKERYREYLRDALNNKKMGHSYTWNIVRKDGIARTISARIKVIRDADQIVHVQGTFLDITERKEVEETLSLMNSMLVNSYEKQKLKTDEVSEANSKLEESHNEMEAAKAEAERASCSKSEFLANMSHEIRTPLNAMNGFISLLKDDESDKEKLKYLDNIEHSSETLLQIINDILDCSKIESGKLEIEKIDFQPKKELYSTAKLFQAKAAEKEIALDINCHEDIPNVLHGDVLRLKQVLSNLLSNAIKFTDSKGEISCRIKYDEEVLSFRVKDSGIGIAEDKLQHVFESFSQADSSIVREYGGTGLGLTISAKLVEMLGGELKVESQLGMGSTFFFSVPVGLGEELAEEDEQDEQMTEIQGHLLLVEDNDANRMFVGIILSGAGLTYETANNGIEAVEKFRDGKFDLILMDENMPKLNGIGATKEILQIEQEKGLEHTPIVALTANALVGDRQLFIDAGMDDYLAKPLEPVQLIQKIGSLIGEK